MNNYEIKQIPISEIFADKNFNCRGGFEPSSCANLAEDLKRHGQLHPVMVRPYSDPAKPQLKWQMVEGFRRLIAARILHWDTILATLALDLSEQAAAEINYTENLHRQNLTFAEEARGLIKFKIGDVDDAIIARHLNVGRSWVQQRREYLALPTIIQREIEKGIIPQGQIGELYKIPTDEERYAAVRKYKEDKLKGKKAKIQSNTTRKREPHKRKARDKNECLSMQEHIRESFRAYGEIDEITIYLRALAWAAGIISDTELYIEVQNTARSIGIPYEIPKAVFEILEA